MLWYTLPGPCGGGGAGEWFSFVIRLFPAVFFFWRLENFWCPVTVWNFVTLHEPASFSQGRDSSVGIDTCHGLDGPRIESILEPDFPGRP